jgi:hypothetical protein
MTVILLMLFMSSNLSVNTDTLYTAICLFIFCLLRGVLCHSDHTVLNDWMTENNELEDMEGFAQSQI